MAMTDAELFGVDLALSEDGDLVVDASGDLALSSGVACIRDDIRARAYTARGTLLEDADWGAGLPDLLQDDEVSDETLSELLRRELLADERIAADTVEVVRVARAGDDIDAEFYAEPVSGAARRLLEDKVRRRNG